MPPSPAKASPRTPSSIAPCAWWRRPRPPCRSCSTRATRRSSTTRSSTSSPAPTPSRARPTSWSPGTASCSSPATPTSRPWRWAASLRELFALRPDRMKVIPGPDGWPEAFEYTAGGRSVRFSGEVVPGVRPILHVKLFNPVNDHYGLSPIEAAATAIDIHNTASALEQGAPRQLRPPLRRAGLHRPRRQPLPRPVRPPQNRAGARLPRRRPRRPPAAARRRPRLEVDEPLPQGHGLHRGQAHRRPRDRPGPRRPTHAPRHPRRQHLLQLPGGHPLPLAPNRPAARHPHRQSPLAVAVASLRRPSRAQTRLRRHRSPEPPSARPCGRASTRPPS